MGQTWLQVSEFMRRKTVRMMQMLLMIEAASGEDIIDVDDLDGSANGSSNVFSFV